MPLPPVQKVGFSHNLKEWGMLLALCGFVPGKMMKPRTVHTTVMLHSSRFVKNSCIISQFPQCFRKPALPFPPSLLQNTPKVTESELSYLPDAERDGCHGGCLRAHLGTWKQNLPILCSDKPFWMCYFILTHALHRVLSPLEKGEVRVLQGIMHTSVRTGCVMLQ